MSEIKVKSGSGDDAKQVVVNYDFPADIGSAVEKYGDESVMNLLHGAITLKLQAVVRQKLTAGEADVQAAVDSWQPGVRGPVAKKSPFERAAAALGNLSPEQLAELAARVKAAQRASHGG